MPTEMELTLEQTQQGVSYEVLNIQVILLIVKMEILLEPTSNKLMVGYESSIDFQIDLSIQSVRLCLVGSLIPCSIYTDQRGTVVLPTIGAADSRRINIKGVCGALDEPVTVGIKRLQDDSYSYYYLVSALKLPVLKTGDYDLWSMRMEQYLTHTDYALWEVIVYGDAPVIASASTGTKGPIPPKTAEQKLARKNELKAKSTMLLVIPDGHLLKFHGIKDAKNLWEAIKARFGGNKESKKMQKTILKQQYENFAASRSEGLDKTYYYAPRNQGNRNGDAPRRVVPVETPANALVVQDGIDDKAGLGYDSQINKSEVVHSVFNNRESYVDNSLVNDRFKTGEGFHAVPPPYIGNYMPSRPDLSFAGLDDYVYMTKVSATETSISKTSKDIVEKPKTVRPSAPIIED
ncbi:hypothetical protein Tco_0595191 [Tanacetum coccineum]